MNSLVLEICANSVQSALNAAEGGADRVELCDNLWEGGTTPSIASIQLAVEKSQLPVFVLIRPRGGDFVYSDLEFELMKKDIIEAKARGAAGIVSGILYPDGSIDKVRTEVLVRLSRPLSFTFHRAIDLTADLVQAIEDCIACGAQRILTSGQQNSVTEGIEGIKEMLKIADGRIGIMPGGGVSIQNIQQLIDLGCSEFHASAKAYVDSNFQRPNAVRMNSAHEIPEDKTYLTSIEKVKELRNALDQLAW